jgi:hypothetical protein
MVNVNVNIDKLVLDGFSQRDLAEFSESLQAELSLLVSANGILNAQMPDNNQIHTKNMRLQHKGGGENVHSAGVEVARSIYNSMVGGKNA